MGTARIRQPYIGTARSVNVTGTATGAIAAGSYFTGFANGAGSVFSATNWTTPSTSKKYFGSTNAKDYALLSDDNGRDVEVTTWVRYGTVFMRIADGKAIYFAMNQEANNLYIGIATNLTFGSANFGSNYTHHDLWSTTTLGTTAGADLTTTQNATWTFGVSGFDIYAKYNDVEFMRIKEYRCMQNGQVACQNVASYGFRDTTLTWLHPAKLRSYDTSNFLDLRDFGLSPLSAVGSISASSNTLTLTSNPGFNVGDPIIVEIGGEAGLGVPGTSGVGGTWPALSYANTTAMDADTSHVNNTLSWDQSSGDIYQYSTGSSTWTRMGGALPALSYASLAAMYADTTQAANTYCYIVGSHDIFRWITSATPARWSPTTNPYITKAVPKSLNATITAINGLALSLDTSATTTTTGANVYFDNHAIVRNISTTTTFSDITPDYLTLQFPEGNFAISGRLSMAPRTGWQFAGRGSDKTMIFSPKGCPSAWISVGGGSYVVVRDLHLQGNVKDTGYGFAWDTDYSGVTLVNETTVPSSTGYCPGIYFNGCQSSVAQDCIVTNVWQKAVGIDYGSDCWAYRVTNYQTHELKKYIQWQFSQSDSYGGGFVDCVVDSNYYIAGIESFRGHPIDGVGQTFTNCSARNGSFSCNTTGYWHYDQCSVVLEPNKWGLNGAFSFDNPIINVNGNIGGNADANYGGTLSVFTCTQQGEINSTYYPGVILRQIVVNTSTPNITVNGATLTYPAGSAGGASGIDQNASGTGLVLNNITCPNASTNPTYGDISVASDATLSNISAAHVFKGGVPWP